MTSTPNTAAGAGESSTACAAAHNVAGFKPGFDHPDFQADAELQIVGAKRAGLGTSRNYYMIDPFELEFLPGLNGRDDDDEDRSAVLAMAQNMCDDGYIVDEPISVLVLKNGDKTTVVALNHTRTKAARMAIRMGAKFKTVPVIPVSHDPATRDKGYAAIVTLEDAIVHSVRSNAHRPFSPVAMARNVMRLRLGGRSAEWIAAKLGVSLAAVHGFETLASCDQTVIMHVEQGNVAPSRAIKAVRKHGTRAAEVVDKAVQRAKRAGKPRATAELDPPSVVSRALVKSVAPELLHALVEVRKDQGFAGLSENARLIVIRTLAAAGVAQGVNQAPAAHRTPDMFSVTQTMIETLSRASGHRTELAVPDASC